MNVRELIVITFFFTVSNCHLEKKSFTCFQHFGCVNFSEQWYHTTLRPVNLPPLERHIINTKLLLLTKENRKTLMYDIITANPKTIKTSAYMSHLHLMIMIHDFTSNGYTGWIKHMALRILSMEKYNVISVDWQEGAEPPYEQAISNALVVAMETEMLLNTLISEFQLNPCQVHIVGHGVGGHIAGYIGKSLRGLIGRITALDPSGPRFEGMPPVVHLHYKDAFYVEVIHTDGAGRNHEGTLEPMGNMDFYFNEGFNQPGCKNQRSSHPLLTLTRKMLKQGTVLPDCSHKRAFKYYIDSLHNKECQYLALPMHYPRNAHVDCLDTSEQDVVCASIGLNIDIPTYAKQINAKYKILTSNCNPFCLSRYQIEINFAKCPHAEREMTGFFTLQFKVDEETKPFNITVNKEKIDKQVIVSGRRLTFAVYQTGRPRDVFHTMQMEWHFTTPFCFHCNNATCVSQVTISHIRGFCDLSHAPLTYKFCPCTGAPYNVLYDRVVNKKFNYCLPENTIDNK